MKSGILLNGLLLASLFLFPLRAESLDAEKERAVANIKAAILQIKPIRILRRDFERYAYRRVVHYTGMSRETLGTISAVGFTVMEGQINTDVLKLKINVFGGTLRPRGVYDWKNNVTAGNLSITWGWE